MATPIPALIGLTGGVVLVGVGLKTIEQIDVQGQKIIKQTRKKAKKTRRKTRKKFRSSIDSLPMTLGLSKRIGVGL